MHGLSLLEELPPNRNISAKASLGGVSFSVDTENYRPSSSKPSWVIEMERDINESVHAENQEVGSYQGVVSKSLANVCHSGLGQGGAFQ